MVKRSFSEYAEDNFVEDGPEAKIQAMGNSFAMKFLFSEAEMRAIGQQGEEIQQMSGATLATTGELYPSTSFQELNIAGPNTEAVLSAAVYALAHIVQVEGAVTNGEEDVPHGEGRLRIVVPTKSAASVIGKGGSTIAHIRAITKLYVHVDTAKVPPDAGPLSEQIVSLSGPLVGLQDGLATILEHVFEMVGEPWFAAWASSTNVGLEFPGIALELSGKGMHGGTPLGGKGGPVNINAEESLGISGEVCQFFSRSGWCRWGDACRHVHSGGPAVPINQPLQSAFPSGSAGGTTGEVCDFFSKAGWCKFADACRYVHPGGGATVGSAAAGGSGASAVSILNAFGVRGEAPKPTSAVGISAPRPTSSVGFSAPRPTSTVGFSAPAPSQSGEVCRFFQKNGWCMRGDGCWHVHVEGPAGATGVGAPTGAREVCQFFMKTGTCKWGDSCHHSHDGSMAGAQPGVQPGFDMNGFAIQPPVGRALDSAENLDSLYGQYLE